MTRRTATWRALAGSVMLAGAGCATPIPVDERAKPFVAIRPPVAEPPPAAGRTTAGGPPEVVPAQAVAPADKPAGAAREKDTPAGPSAAGNDAAGGKDQPSAPPRTPPSAGGAITLVELEQLALEVNPILRRDSAQIDAAKGQAVQAGLWSNPRFDSNNPQVFNGRQTVLNVGFQQEIPVMGKKKLDQAAANEGTRQQEWQTLQDKFTLLTNVRVQFYTVLADQRRVRVLTDLAKTVKGGVDALAAKAKAGDSSEADVMLARADYQRVVAALKSAEAILDGDRKQLGAIVGVPGLIDRPVEGVLDKAYPEFDETALLRYVGEDHTAINNQRSVVAQNQFQLRRAEVEPYPNPYLGPAYQLGVSQGSDQFWFNIQFNIPTWDRNQGNIRAARANVAAAVAQVATTRNDLVNQVSNTLSQYKAARALVGEFEKNIIPQATEAVRLYRSALDKGGAIDTATFLQSLRTLVQANSDYVDALQNLWTSAAQVAGLYQAERFVDSPLPPPSRTPIPPARPR